MGVRRNNRFVVRLCPRCTPRAIRGFVGLITRNFCSNINFRHVISNFVTRNNSPSNAKVKNDKRAVVKRFSSGKFPRGALSRREKIVSVTESVGPSDTDSRFFVYCSSTSFLSKRCTTFNGMVRNVRAISNFLSVPERAGSVNRTTDPGVPVVVRRIAVVRRWEEGRGRGGCYACFVEFGTFWRGVHCNERLWQRYESLKQGKGRSNA